MDEIHRFEKKEHELSCLMLMCESVEELDRFATTFNNAYKIIRDSKLRVEEIENEIEKRFGKHKEDDKEGFGLGA